MRCERFIIEYRTIRESCSINRIKYCFHPIIFDRVKQKEIIKVDTGDSELDDELIENILTMMNIKYVGRDEEE